MHEPQEMYMMCMAIFEYSTTEVTLPSCLSVPSEHVERCRVSRFRPRKTSEEEEKCVASAIPR